MKEVEEAFKRLARSVGRSPHFWRLMSERLLNGDVPELDLRRYWNKPQSPFVAAKNMHRHLFPKDNWDDLKEKHQRVWLELVAIAWLDLWP